ncbi:unnamed protein product [Rotaria sordida]|uniref:Uncharacterized protein n=1 Tax=Rotaria sordida TaxID=392033 RepID=A0A813XGL7_9BILA|nr:unnamed protein product [Rotaria sordida]
MNNHRCKSQKSLITIRKWLVESGDGPSTTICIPSSRIKHDIQQKSCLNKIIKRKRFNNQKYYSNTTSFIDWFYEFVKKIFLIYDERKSKYDEQIYHPTIDDTTISTITCSTCQLKNIDPYINTIQSTLKSSKNNLVLHSQTNTKIMVTTATSSSNLNIPQSIILHSSKSTQTQAHHNEQHSTVYPLYCFSVKDGQILPLMLSSFSSSNDIPKLKEVTSSFPICINNETSEYCNPLIDSSISPLTTDIYSHSSYRPTIASITSSNSNTISLKTTQNPMKDNILSKIHRPSSSLHDTRICHFDKRNCLIECCHSSNIEKKYPSNFYRCSSTNTNTPEVVFAESTCQLIKQAWLSSISDQQVKF